MSLDRLTGLSAWLSYHHFGVRNPGDLADFIGPRPDALIRLRVQMIKLTETREIKPYVWVRPDEERLGPAGWNRGDVHTTISINDDRRRRARVAGGLRVRRKLLNHRQLQHGHSLPFKELRYEHTASIWKFDSIMVAIRNVWVYCAEFPHPEINPALPKPSVVVFDIFGEGQFGPRKHADRYRWLAF
jgi:hypothetical protein